jgi:hypothetical protein
MIADRGAWRAPEATGTRVGAKRGHVRISTQVTEERFGEIKALALLNRRSMSSQVKELLSRGLEPR